MNRASGGSIGPRFRKPREIRHPSVSLEYLAGRRFFVSHSSHVPTPLPSQPFERGRKKRRKGRRKKLECALLTRGHCGHSPLFVRGGSVPLAPLSSYFHRDWPKCLSKDTLRLQTNVHSHISFLRN